MVSHALVDGANQVRAGVRQAETEVTTGIDSGMGNFFHPLPERDQDYAVSCCRLTRGAVGDPTREGLSGEGRGGGKKYATNNNNDGERPSRLDSRSSVLQIPCPVSVQILRLTRSNAVSSFLPRANAD